MEVIWFVIELNYRSQCSTQEYLCREAAMVPIREMVLSKSLTLLGPSCRQRPVALADFQAALRVVRRLGQSMEEFQQYATATQTIATSNA